MGQEEEGGIEGMEVTAMMIEDTHKHFTVCTKECQRMIHDAVLGYNIVKANIDACPSLLGLRRSKACEHRKWN